MLKPTLLKLFPAWIERLGEVAAKYPLWESIVRDWSELDAYGKKVLLAYVQSFPRRCDKSTSDF